MASRPRGGRGRLAAPVDAVSVGPIHVVTALLVVAAVASGTLAVSVSDDETQVRPAGGATVAERLVDADDAETDGAAIRRQRVGGTTEPDGSTASVNATDTDADGLIDERERSLGADPTDPDTDGDGIPDGTEVDDPLYPDADPLEHDIYVEVDATGENRLSEAAVDLIERTFADAPVENPSGGSGIDIHVLVDDRGLESNATVYSTDRPGPRDDMYDFREDHFDASGSAYYYVVLADDVAYDGQPRYVGAGRPGIVAMQTFDAPKLTASLFMHELGHAFGLDGRAEGVDSKTYSTEEYDSVMNYNGLYDQLAYSNGTDGLGRDEWQYVARERHQPGDGG
ncbi:MULTISPECIES: hypothetical protein [Halomicrobium]|uniref:Uncharacterized protein n=2 Tax=Halomicrobium mukohataei TaxID=57705 RepID=C7P2P3_HALMD|nr:MULTISPECIES: hypothetical protein [Halomicrobium]ACV47365.1 hypothetical protein Hmuk_1243 [Halomicrobium mukohataei DSM 12286]QCD65832.1 hypothetical protein E5139_09390 [Halomicrobium mukohataei]QFR20637.1 hypothetical protein GBQ70_09385 [Halomicrobium sp. ZPS1]